MQRKTVSKSRERRFIIRFPYLKPRDVPNINMVSGNVDF